MCAGPGGAASGARPCVDAVHDVATTRWLKLQTLDYTDEAGKARKWDMASRTTKRAGTSDGVAILALLRSAGSSTVETLLVERTPHPRQRPGEMDWIHGERLTHALLPGTRRVQATGRPADARAAGRAGRRGRDRRGRRAARAQGGDRIHGRTSRDLHRGAAHRPSALANSPARDPRAPCLRSAPVHPPPPLAPRTLSFA